MIVFNGMDLIILAIGAILLIICGITLIVDHMVYTIKKRKKNK